MYLEATHKIRRAKYALSESKRKMLMDDVTEIAYGRWRGGGGGRRKSWKNVA